jgi:hypothetical protein
VGIADTNGIDAPAGVTIQAEAGSGCSLEGTYTLAGGGVLKVG